MNLETFYEHFELLADAPNAVPKLREMVLQLAVRGKLVEQYKDDEPARVFLSKIQQNKFESESQTIKESEKPFEIPTSWEWMRFSDVADFRAGKTPSRKDSGFWAAGVYPWVSIADMKRGETLLETKEQVSDVAASEVFRGAISPKGTLLMSFKLTIGKMSILGVDAFHNEAIISIYPHHEVLRDYFLKCLNGFDLSAGNKDAIKGKTLNRQSLSSIVLAVPPQNEIVRILSKYDELMALCDDLEQKQRARAEGRARLNAAVLTGLSSAPDEHSFKRAWARVGSAFDALYSTSETIGDLRKTVLQLAVQGKLVRQDLNDEPAEKLLKEVEAAHHIKIHNRRSLHHPELYSEGNLISSPPGWVKVKLDQISDVGTGSTPLKSNPEYYEGGTVPWITSSLTGAPVVIAAEKFITEKARTDCRLKIYPVGTLVVALYGQGKTRGQVTELHIDATVNQACAAIVFVTAEKTLKQFVKLVLQKQYTELRALAVGGAQPNLNVAKIKGIEFFLPPLQEQKRIVAKVDELMALVDELETGLLQAQGDSERLLESLLQNLLGAGSRQLITS